MRLIELLDAEAAASGMDVDAASRGPVTPQTFRQYLTRTFGFVAPVERSITTTPDIESSIDVRRFKKEELLRRDLAALRLTVQQINALPQCSVPLFNAVEEALGWAYVVERTTLAHQAIFQRFAMVIPGEVAFASLYLKCYLGSVGEMWQSFGEMLDLFARNAPAERRLLDAAKTAFHFYRRWHAPAEDEQEPRRFAGDVHRAPSEADSDQRDEA